MATLNEKVFLVEDWSKYQGNESPATANESKVLREACLEIDQTRIISEDRKQTLTATFQKRFAQALAVAEARRVRRYHFTPSGRTVWVVNGRGRDYQVLPESMFCTCDDYYFRVMENKKQLCYHILAQQLSQAMRQYEEMEMADSRHPEILSKLSMSSAR